MEASQLYANMLRKYSSLILYEDEGMRLYSAKRPTGELLENSSFFHTNFALSKLAISWNADRHASFSKKANLLQIADGQLSLLCDGEVVQTKAADDFSLRDLPPPLWTVFCLVPCLLCRDLGPPLLNERIEIARLSESKAEDHFFQMVVIDDTNDRSYRLDICKETFLLRRFEKSYEMPDPAINSIGNVKTTEVVRYSNITFA